MVTPGSQELGSGRILQPDAPDQETDSIQEVMELVHTAAKRLRLDGYPELVKRGASWPFAVPSRRGRCVPEVAKSGPEAGDHERSL
jgi:hypothetical protein